MENQKALTKEDIKQMLLANHNIILHGAPGTGKTYLAKKIAEELGATEANGRFKMVQFHPSYDYTDFVEGLRPRQVGNSIAFKRENGVFKEFCKNAVNAKNKSVPANNDSDIVDKLKNAWEILIEDINSGKIYNFKLKDKGYTTDINFEKTDKKRIRFKRQDSGDNGNVVRLDDILRLAQSYPNSKALKTVENLKVVGNAIASASNGKKKTAGCDVSKCWAVLMYLYGKCEEQQNTTPINTTNEEPFIFLIDEINRGDMSKIFGELFYAIDPGNRGIEGKIDTQYQNLIEKGKGDPFDSGFYVPDNVYIIGTMNDIDRSVESMDFAMRRRFQFIEVTAESRAEEMFKDDMGNPFNNADTAKKKMTDLNDCIISKEIGLSKAYQIGGSYFKKFAAGNEDAQSLWDYRLKGLLREYLRGEEDSTINVKLEKLKQAFDNADNKSTLNNTSENEAESLLANDSRQQIA